METQIEENLVLDLSKLELKERYKKSISPEVDLSRDFYKPCLEQSILYQRAVGFFTSKTLKYLAANGLEQFYKNDGKMQLVVSPILFEQDIEAIREGEMKKEAISERILQGLEDINEMELTVSQLKNFEFLTFLVEKGRLEIKICRPDPKFDMKEDAMYHDKIGIFQDELGNRVSFDGSQNDSELALDIKGNHESINANCSWLKKDESRCETLRSEFEILWRNDELGWIVESFDSALKKGVLEIMQKKVKKTREYYVVNEPEEKFQLWKHQKVALETFLKEKRGILEMATGTGKTITALAIVENLILKDQVDTVIISTKSPDLLDQWHEDVIETGSKINRLVLNGSKKSDELKFLNNPKRKILLCTLHNVVNVLKELKEPFKTKTLIVYDEVHEIGSEETRKKLDGLTDTIPFCLGLSATPEKMFDEDSNNFLKKHVGEIIFKFEIQDAIRERVLCPINYFPLLFEPSKEDKNQIKKIRSQAEAREGTDNPMSEEELRMKLAKVYKLSKEKLPKFQEFLKKNENILIRCIIFVEEMKYGEKVMEIINKFTKDFHTYYSLSKPEYLNKFKDGELNCLITCHKLAQGIDIQDLKNIVLFSSEKGRLETVQRIGRGLRFDPKDPDKRANIIDFIREKKDGGSNTDTERMEWLQEIASVEPKKD